MFAIPGMFLIPEQVLQSRRFYLLIKAIAFYPDFYSLYLNSTLVRGEYQDHFP